MKNEEIELKCRTASRSHKIYNKHSIEIGCRQISAALSMRFALNTRFFWVLNHQRKKRNHIRVTCWAPSSYTPLEGLKYFIFTISSVYEPMFFQRVLNMKWNTKKNHKNQHILRWLVSNKTDDSSIHFGDVYTAYSATHPCGS